MILVFKKGHKISEEQKRMMRERMTGKKNPFYGKTHSEKTKKMLRERVYSEKTRKRISLAGMGRKHSEETKRKMTGRRHTEKTKRKMSESRKGKKTGRKLSEEHKKKLTFKGRKHTKKSKKKISLAGMGRKLTEKAKKAIGLAQKGKKLSEETKQKRLVTMKKRYPVGKFPGMPGHVPWHKGKTGVFSDEAIEKIRKRRAEMKLPVKDTWPEKQLQKMLNDDRIPFVMQKNFHLGFQQHQVDIFIEPNICVEVDGDYTHANPHPYPRPSRTSTIHPGHKPSEIMWSSSKIIKTAKWIWENDKKITEALKQQGNTVLRFWQSELETEPEKCLQKIIKIIKESTKI